MARLARELRHDIITPTKTGYNVKKVSDDMLRDMWAEGRKNFDKGFPDGVYVAPCEKNEPTVKMRELFAYCKKVGKRPAELTDEERQQFIGHPDF
ncbi:hypothetical protein [Mesobacillus foraminis]|uniref:Uncharacterized protein n=1 Tax=Mesobacillus foraminis TaxID=279826 RepID=A0A4R2AY76_9BACI|nr:hypothetical protein [Mesobacillus foraminis]TCN18931.1 hypothetical protein EV146_11818 [Mesobacillus foraminis]